MSGREWDAPHPENESGAGTFVQWKGTSVCMDFRCACGGSGHVDADFAYFVRCPACGEVWEMGTELRVQRVDAERVAGLDQLVIAEVE